MYNITQGKYDTEIVQYILLRVECLRENHLNGLSGSKMFCLNGLSDGKLLTITFIAIVERYGTGNETLCARAPQSTI